MGDTQPSSKEGLAGQHRSTLVPFTCLLLSFSLPPALAWIPFSDLHIGVSIAVAVSIGVGVVGALVVVRRGGRRRAIVVGLAAGILGSAIGQLLAYTGAVLLSWLDPVWLGFPAMNVVLFMLWSLLAALTVALAAYVHPPVS